MLRRIWSFAVAALIGLNTTAFSYELVDHPRIFITKADLPGLAQRSKGALKGEYAKVKAVADSVLKTGVAKTESRFRPPIGLICSGICYLVERELGGNPEPYAGTVKKYWGDGAVLGLDGDGYFGYNGMLYDWIYDALTPEERRTYGDKLGEWLRFYTDTPEITLQWGGWWYNQTWGPAHLNTPNTRDGITPKLFVALALAGADTKNEADARTFLDSWARRVPAECIPAFDEMGGVWSESMGHGGYGPIIVIPWAFEAWRTATGEDLFARCAPTSYLPQMTRWAAFLTVPFAGHTAWIDDNRASKLTDLAQVAPILGARYRDPVDNWISDQDWAEGWNRIPWNRFLSYDPSVKSDTPKAEKYPLADLFKGAGHVYMRSAWDDPNGTWAFFGAGPKFEGHSRDDEGHFLIAKKGWLAMRVGGGGHNDDDYYEGGALAFNIVTIYNKDEQYRRVVAPEPGGVNNENDGGMLRLVYSSHERDDRATMVSYRNNEQFTYAAADLSLGYSKDKVSEVTRQFFYLRGKREFFIIFDRIQAASEKFPRHWFIHLPGEPSVSGAETALVPGHVLSYNGNSATWLSDPAGEKDVLSTGKARAFLTSLLPAGAKITKRGGEGYDFWGHPDETTAQYNHIGKSSRQPPVVPWRLEEQSPGQGLRDYFLNVIEIGDENDSKASGVSLVEREGFAGAHLDAAGTPVEVLFSREGALTARVKIGAGAESVIEPGVE